MIGHLWIPLFAFWIDFTESELTAGPSAHPARCCSLLLQTPAALSHPVSGLLSQSPLCCLRSVKQDAKGIMEMVNFQVVASDKAIVL